MIKEQKNINKKKQSDDDDDDDDDDYRKGYMKARNEKKKDKINAPPDFDNIDTVKFSSQFAQQLLQQRGLQISEHEFGLKQQQDLKKNKKAAFVQGSPSTLQELQIELVKAVNNLHQVSTVLKDILALGNLPKELFIYYAVLRAEILIKNKQFFDCKELCYRLQERDLNIMDKVRVLLSLTNALTGIGEIWNASMQMLRAKSYMNDLKQLDMNQLSIISPFDVNLDDVVKLVEELQLAVMIRIAKEKIFYCLLYAQGISNTGGLGLGDEIIEIQEPQMIPSLKGRSVLSLSCGDHHVLALVTGCSCQNPYDPDFQCMGNDLCNQGSEVLGWGENFMGQSLGHCSATNYITQPSVIKGLSGKNITGVVAKRSISMAWSQSGQLFQWGSNQYSGLQQDIIINQDITIKNIVSIGIGINFIAILDINRQVYVQGGLGTTQSTKPIIYYQKPKKLDQNNITQLSVGDYHLLVLDESGQVYGMGSNEFGQLGMRPSEGIFQSNLQSLKQIQQANHIHCQANISLVITFDGELLYMGELTELKQIDYPKSSQLPENQTLLSASVYGGQIYALCNNGIIYRWSPDNEPKFKFFKQGPYRQIHLGRGIRILRNNLLRGGFCSIALKLDQEGNLPVLYSYQNINIDLNINDEFGPYGIQLLYPVRIHYFLTNKPNKNIKEIIDLSQQYTKKSTKIQYEPKIYTSMIIDEIKDKLISFNLRINPLDPSKYIISLQVKEAGIYHLILLINEEPVQNSSLELQINQSQLELDNANQQQISEQLMIEKEKELKAKFQEQSNKEQENKKKIIEENEQIIQKQRETCKLLYYNLILNIQITYFLEIRAEQALKLQQQQNQENQKKIEDERKMKKDIMTGGGFDLNKLNEIKEQQKIDTKNFKSTLQNQDFLTKFNNQQKIQENQFDQTNNQNIRQEISFKQLKPVNQAQNMIQPQKFKINQQKSNGFNQKTPQNQTNQTIQQAIGSNSSNENFQKLQQQPQIKKPIHPKSQQLSENNRSQNIQYIQQQQAKYSVGNQNFMEIRKEPQTNSVGPKSRDGKFIQRQNRIIDESQKQQFFPIIGLQKSAVQSIDKNVSSRQGQRMIMTQAQFGLNGLIKISDLMLKTDTGDLRNARQQFQKQFDTPNRIQPPQQIFVLNQSPNNNQIYKEKQKQRTKLK